MVEDALVLVGVTLIKACDCITKGERGIALAPDTGGLVLSPFEAVRLEVLNVILSCLCMNVSQGLKHIHVSNSENPLD